MQGDDFVTEDIVPRCHAFGNRDGPGVVGGKEFIGGPSTRHGCVFDETFLIDLGEFERGFIDRAAVAVAVGQVVHDGAVVGFGPLGPLELDG